MRSESIPVIDIKTLQSPETLAQLDHACRDWGFFQVTNHGIANSVLRNLSDAMHAFFTQPTALKREIIRTRENPWGFFDRELTKNVRDWKQVYDFGPNDGNAIRPQWPRHLPDFEAAIRAYSSACEQLSYRLLAAVSSNLGMSPDFLGRGFGPAHTSFLRLNYYPVHPRPGSPEGLSNPESEQLGINRHTDAGALTLLLQDDQPGLEVRRYDRWHLVKPRRDALVINIGDIVQVWSNDRYCASLHRVVTSAVKARFSVVMERLSQRTSSILARSARHGIR